jgi:hypothetical protein
VPREELAQPAQLHQTEQPKRETGEDGGHGEGKHGRRDECLVVGDVGLEDADDGMVEGDDLNHHTPVSSLEDRASARKDELSDDATANGEPDQLLGSEGRKGRSSRHEEHGHSDSTEVGEGGYLRRELRMKNSISLGRKKRKKKRNER